jgi:hypothetical protein
MEEMRNLYNTLVGNPEGKTPFVRPSHRWEYNITMDLREIGWEGVNRIHLAKCKNQWRASVNAEINLRVV